MAIVDESDYDGIDLDWEYPDTKDEVAGFERLTRRFRKELDALGRKKGRPMLLTMAASANPGTLKWLDKEFLLETMDWINVMTYDFTGDWTNYAGHHSPLLASSKQPGGSPRSTESTMKLPARGAGPARESAGGRHPALRPGLRRRASRTRRPRVPRRARSRRATTATSSKLIKEQGWTRHWDDETKNPWLIAPDRSVVIGYDDAESVALKTEWAMKQGFRGVFFWQIGADRCPTGPIRSRKRRARSWMSLPNDMTSVARVARPEHRKGRASKGAEKLSTPSRCSGNPGLKP